MLKSSTNTTSVPSNSIPTDRVAGLLNFTLYPNVGFVFPSFKYDGAVGRVDWMSGYSYLGDSFYLLTCIFLTNYNSQNLC